MRQDYDESENSPYYVLSTLPACTIAWRSVKFSPSLPTLFVSNLRWELQQHSAELVKLSRNQSSMCCGNTSHLLQPSSTVSHQQTQLEVRQRTGIGGCAESQLEKKWRVSVVSLKTPSCSDSDSDRDSFPHRPQQTCDGYASAQVGCGLSQSIVTNQRDFPLRFGIGCVWLIPPSSSIFATWSCCRQTNRSLISTSSPSCRHALLQSISLLKTTGLWSSQHWPTLIG
jgi:hypothetical protein